MVNILSKVSTNSVKDRLESTFKKVLPVVSITMGAVKTWLRSIKDGYVEILETAASRNSSNKDSSKFRLDYLDSLRGILAVMVILHHFRCGFAPCNLWADATDLNFDVSLCQDWTVFNVLFSFLFNGTFCIFVFFVMSGFVLSRGLWKAPADVWRLAVAKRYFRLAIPCAASMIMGYLLGGFNWHREAAAITKSKWLYLLSSERPEPIYGLFSQLVLGIFHGSSTLNNALWTIQIELFGSFLTFLLVFLLKGSPHRIRTRWLKVVFVIMILPSVTRNRAVLQTRVEYDKQAPGESAVTHRAVDVDLFRNSHVVSQLFEKAPGNVVPMSFREHVPDPWDLSRTEIDKDVAVLDKPKSTIARSNAEVVVEMLKSADPLETEYSNLRIEMSRMHTWRKVNPLFFYAAFVAGLYISEYSLSTTDKGYTGESKYIHCLVIFAVVCAAYPNPSIEASRFFLWNVMHQIASIFGCVGFLAQCFWNLFGASALVYYIVVHSAVLRDILVSHPFLMHLGKLSFSMYLTHLPIMFSLTSLFFLQLYRVLGSYLGACFFALLLSAPTYFVSAHYFYKYIDQPAIIVSGRLGRRILGMAGSSTQDTRKEPSTSIEDGIPTEVITEHSQGLSQRSSSFHGSP